MNIRHLITVSTAALALAAAALPAAAETPDDASFSGMARMARMDMNHDSMVSKKEFLDTMGKVWDMKMKQMSIKGDKITEAQMREILMYLKAGA